MCVVASAASWIGELGHTQVMLQSGGAPAELAFIEAVKKRVIEQGTRTKVLARQG